MPDWRRMSRGRKYLLGAVLVAMVALGALYVLLFADDDPADTGTQTSNQSALIATVDGRDVTEEDLALALAEVERSRRFLSAEADALESALDARALLDLLDAYSPETVAFAGVLMDAAIEAEFIERGLAPSEAEVEAWVATQAKVYRQAMSGELPARPEDVAYMQGVIAAVGEDAYLGRVLADAGFRALGEERLREAVMAPEEGLDARDAWMRLRLELAHSADVRIVDPGAGFDIENALDYLDRFTAVAFGVSR